MADESYRKTFYTSDFSALAVGTIASNKTLIDAALAGLTLTVPVNETRVALGGNALIVEWQTLPAPADVAAVTAAVAAFTGGETTSAPFEYNSFGASTTTSGTHQTKLDDTTPALDAGTYQVLWSSSLRMQAVIANTGIEGKMRVTRSDGVFVEQTDAWDRANAHAYNGALTFQISGGQTIRTHLTFARLGASGTAEMSGVRITVDKIS